MNRSCFGFILASFLALPTYAQYSLEGCSPTDLGEKAAKCLAERLNELSEHNNTERARLQKIIDDLRSEITNLKGPRKIVELIPEVKGAVTIGYWAKGQHRQEFNCVPPIENKAGHTLYGAELSAEMDTTNQPYPIPNLCHPPGWCDSAGEFCRWKNRAKGCYVNTEWYNWYQEMNRQQGSIYKINYETICSQ